MTNKECECCQEEKGITHKGGYLLCRKCSHSDFSKVEALIIKRHEKKIEKALSELTN